MTSWRSFEEAEPELAARAHAILASTTNCVLGTIRADGTPRLSGIDPWFGAGELWLGSMPRARKGADLRRDPRVSLHSIPWESRKPKEGHDPIAGDAKLTGTVELVTDAERIAAAMAAVAAIHAEEAAGDAGAAESAADGGAEGDDGEAASVPEMDLFRIRPESVVVISVADDLLVIDRWSATEGRTTVRRQ